MSDPHRYAGVITSVRITHTDATIDELARVRPSSQRHAVSDLLRESGIQEAFVLSTCNRVEAYVVTAEPDDGRSIVSEWCSDPDVSTITVSGHEESIRHLLSVAGGLESAVVGEDQILGQIRTAYDDALTAGGIGPILEMAVTKAIRVGERARTETEINEGIVSLGSAAVELLTREHRLDGSNAVVVGAGDMGGLVTKSLSETDIASITVVNRTIPHAEHLVADIDVPGRALGLEDLPSAIDSADVIVTATGSDDPILDIEDFGDHERFVVDLGQPRDVHPTVSSKNSVTVYDLDAIESITSTTQDRRSEAALEVEGIIDEEFDRLMGQFKRTQADEVIAGMYAGAERIKSQEVQTAINRLEEAIDEELSDDIEGVIDAMADSLVNQLLAPPTDGLRDAAADDDWNTINTAIQLFDPGISGEEDDEPLSVADSDSIEAIDTE